MSCTSQNFRLFHVSNLSVRNFRIFLLMYTGSLSAPLPPPGGDDGPVQTSHRRLADDWPVRTPAHRSWFTGRDHSTARPRSTAPADRSPAQSARPLERPATRPHSASLKRQGTLLSSYARPLEHPNHPATPPHSSPASRPLERLARRRYPVRRYRASKLPDAEAAGSRGADIIGSCSGRNFPRSVHGTGCGIVSAAAPRDRYVYQSVGARPVASTSQHSISGRSCLL